ncbi:sialic acid-binding Ig-like lectin 15 [Scyliorhinus canicula]|uniref:sialic acid-binding Ig-like lectin 15 n=1 Tax=Scyliorhinus canicula TaxID=7830 RepID=UPI0018F719F7|nr:sialic acid-binding Ig-like lectin 15 [Scyliorhinus canicula]
MKGDSVTLPCTFTPPDRFASSVTVLWMKGDPYTECTVFNHTRFLAAKSHVTNLVTVNKEDRYELIGNLIQGDASLRISDLQLNDTNDYFCHVHIKKRRRENVIQDVTRLQVAALATILELSAGRNNASGDTIVCRVEGKPFASITWIVPGNRTVPGNSTNTAVTRVPGKYQSVGTFFNPTLSGTYSCVAANKHGRDVRLLHLSVEGVEKSSIVPSIVLALLIISLLFIGFTIWMLKRGELHNINSTAGREGFVIMW